MEGSVALRGFLGFRPSPPRLPIALGAAVSVLAPALGLALAGYPSEGLIASTGAFLALYLGGRGARVRALRLPLIAGGLLAAAALTISVSAIPALDTAAVALVSILGAVLTIGFRAGPPGAIFFAMVGGLIGSLAAPVSIGGGGRDGLELLLLLAGGLLFAYLVAIAPLLVPAVRATTPRAEPMRFRIDGESRIVLIRVVVAVVVAAVVSVPLGVHRSYWVIVAVLAILQSGPVRHLTAVRAAQRVVGTALGAGLFLLLALADPPPVLLALLLAALQFLVEMIVIRQYGLALVLITPLALLVAARAPAVSATGLAVERLLDTLLGALIAGAVLVVEYAAERRASSAR